tara:strand:- start:1575 stop:2744 length:1170 start_codon:yes stop_codon:yes gene_type:complete
VGLVSIIEINNDRPTDNHEMISLAHSAGCRVEFLFESKNNKVHSSFFLSKGKAEELQIHCKKSCVELVIFSEPLSPIQQRNLTVFLKCRVIDRVALILDIFANRARTKEGKLQVEMAQLKYLSTRLVRGWSHLERQRGGIGLRGPGETQLETDRRLIAKRVRRLSDQLVRFSDQCKNRRKSRKKRGAYNVSLVGYTNSGKSTLFNVFTKADVYAANQLFATLDTTTRRVFLEGQNYFILSDTVGFIKDLPHTLIESFKATLSEAANADLLIHVIDRSDCLWEQKFRDVIEVLKEVGGQNVPMINMYNKIDLIGGEPRVRRDQYGRIKDVCASAETKNGLDLLKKAISEQKELREKYYHPADGSTSYESQSVEGDNDLKENYSPKRESLF